MQRSPSDGNQICYLHSLNAHSSEVFERLAGKLMETENEFSSETIKAREEISTCQDIKGE